MTACQSVHDIRGNLISHDDIARLKPLQQTQEDILEILGPPFTQRDKMHWIYVGQEQETKAFLLPQVKKQRVFLVTFDQAGRYIGIEEKVHQGRHTDLDPETAGVKGENLSVVGQTLDNLRRASSQRKKSQ
jgi:outer membrane protein assembly factor BamE (lipoprotein component of BamABCDE complex)